MAKVIKCDCGFIVRGDTEDELVTNGIAHAKEVHNMDLTAEQLLAIAVPAD